MPELLMVKSFGSLKAADPEAEAYIKSLGIGEFVKATITKPRNPKFHRKFMALLRTCFENQDQFNDFTDFRKAVVFECGFRVTRQRIDGSKFEDAASISFSAMDELQFGRLYGKAIDVLSDWLGVTDQELAREIDSFAWERAG